LLSQWIWQHHAELPGLSANFDRRNMRDFILDKAKDSAVGSGLAALNIFEQFQADQKVFLQAQLAHSEWMKDSSFSRKLLATFNGVIFDLSQTPTKDLLDWLRHLEMSPLWYGRMGVLLPPTSQRERKKISRLMVAQKIIHWGYGMDDLNDIYKWELPINTAVTTQEHER
jgi:inorganic triphosphatase YgiF